MLSLLSMLTASAFAYEVDMNYTGPIDVFTGQPIDDTVVTTSSDIVALDENSYYDRRDGMFVYFGSGSGNELRCSVADGMMTTDSVKIELSDGMDCKIFLNGEQIETPAVMQLSEAGAYAVTAGLTAQSSVTIHFTIVSSLCSSIGEYWIPDHFYATALLFNGEEKTTSSNKVDLSEEGEYQITYYCLETRIPYFLDLKVDHTAPTLTLNGVVDGVAKGPVTISDIEPETSLYVELDGQQIAYAGELTKSGSYVVIVSDAAGNATRYDFVMLVYFNASSLVFFAVFVALVIALIVYLARTRKHVRVR